MGGLGADFFVFAVADTSLFGATEGVAAEGEAAFLEAIATRKAAAFPPLGDNDARGDAGELTRGDRGDAGDSGERGLPALLAAAVLARVDEFLATVAPAVAFTVAATLRDAAEGTGDVAEDMGVFLLATSPASGSPNEGDTVLLSVGLLATLVGPLIIEVYSSTKTAHSEHTNPTSCGPSRGASKAGPKKRAIIAVVV